MTNVLRMVPRSHVAVEEPGTSPAFEWVSTCSTLSERKQIRENQARTGTFQRPGTLFASTLERKGSAMSVSVLAPASGCKNQRAEAMK